ncbi:ribonuclease H-like domain-containing protein [Tanacetum coccineum]
MSHDLTAAQNTTNTHVGSPQTTTQTQHLTDLVVIPEPPPHTNPNTVSVHPMVTRFCVGTNRPTQRPSLYVSSVSPLPKSYQDAFNDPNWKNTINDEYRPTDANIVLCMWLFRHKYLADGTLSCYKAHLVANGGTQLAGVDVDETFSLVVKTHTIRTVLSLDASQHLPIHQLDVKNAFLHGDLHETVYMHQPSGFGDSVHPNYVYLLQWSLYGLKQTSRAWFQGFASYITRALLQQIVTSLHQEFSITDLGSLNYFLGIYVTRDSSRMFLSQKKYVVEILERAYMVNCNPSRTPVDTESKLGIDDDPVSDSTLY